MADSSDSRVAVYIDFDNIVISRYDQVNGRNSFQRDRVRHLDPGNADAEGAIGARLESATVDVGAIIDFAASFGTLVLTRAYADWSAPVNADYRHQLVGRAVDLVQLFPAAAYGKNGADIRLAVDAVEDMFRLPDLTHVVIVAGDSDYVPLAQRCKRLGRTVVGIGVAGSSARSLSAACDEFYTYDTLPGIEPTGEQQDSATGAHAPESAAVSSAKKAPARRSRAAGPAAESGEAAGGGSAAHRAEPAGVRDADGGDEHEEESSEEADRDLQADATALLARALRIGHEKDDDEWLHSSAVKSQIKRMDPSFSERRLGHRSFSDFVKSRSDIAELDDSSTTQLVRLRQKDSPARSPRRAKD